MNRENVKSYLTMGGLWCLLVFSAVLVVATAHQIRYSTKEHNQLKQQYNQLSQQKNNLTMEQNALSGYVRLEDFARSELDLQNVTAQSTKWITYKKGNL